MNRCLFPRFETEFLDLNFLVLKDYFGTDSGHDYTPFANGVFGMLKHLRIYK